MPQESRSLTRRGILRAVGITTVGGTALAACGSEDDSPTESLFSFAYGYDLDSFNFNTLLGSQSLLEQAAIVELFRPSIAMLNWDNYQWIPLTAEEVSWESDDLIIKLPSGMQWSNGDPFTAKDIAGSLNVERVMNSDSAVGWSDITEVRVASDRELVISFTRRYQGIEVDVLRTRISPYSLYHEWMDRAEALLAEDRGYGSNEQKKLDEELGAHRPGQADFLTYGPYRLESTGNDVIRFERHPEGRFGSQVTFAKCEVRNADNKEATRLLLKQEIDYSTHVLSADSRDILHDVEGIVELNTEDLVGVGLMLNLERREEYQDRRFRQALLHILDREFIAEAALGINGYYLPTADCGLPNRHIEQIYDPDEVDSLIRYDTDHEAAKRLLRELDWSETEDGWIDENGKLVSVSVSAPDGWQDFEVIAREVADQLRSFGIDAEDTRMDGTDPWTQWNKGDFEISVRHWGNPTVPYHYGSWTMAWFTDNNRTDAEPGMSFPTDEVDTSEFGQVDLNELYRQAREGDTETQAEANRKLGIVFNETLPRIPIALNARITYGIEGVRAKEIDPGEFTNNNVYEDNPIMLRLMRGELELA